LHLHRPHIWIPLVLAVAALAPFAHATTGAGYTVDVPVSVTAAKVTIKKNEFTRAGVVGYPRGTTVHFHVRNTSKKTIRPQLLVLKGLNFIGASHIAKITKAPKSIAPGKTGSFNVYFFFRGQFSFQAVTAGKVTASTRLNVI